MSRRGNTRENAFRSSRFDNVLGTTLDASPAVRHAVGFVTAGLVIAVELSGCSLASADRSAVPPAPAAARVHEGLASFYGPGLDGKRTASGTVLDMNDMIAAHPTYPFGTVVRVTNLKNGKSARLRIEDRGPVPRIRQQGVIIDVSRGAAKALGFLDEGRTRVRVEVVKFPATGSH